MNDLAPFDVTYIRRRVLGRALINGRPRTAYPEYQIWTGLVGRCCNPKNHSWSRYGGRGIKVCDRWRLDFANFLEDMGERPSRRHSIDRVDNDGNYEPGNCRWATPIEQARNKSPGGRADAWTPDDLAILRKMWGEYRHIDEMAAALNRTPGTVRLRAHTSGLRRHPGYTRLSRKHPDLAPILQQRGPDAFLTALREKIDGEKSEKLRQKRAREASLSEVVAGIMARQDDRNSKMRALRLAGCDMAAIARLFGITRERVRQLQNIDFRSPETVPRKVSSTRPENRARHVDRLIRGWNLASVEARIAFLEMAGAEPRATLPRLLPPKRRITREAA